MSSVVLAFSETMPRKTTSTVAAISRKFMSSLKKLDIDSEESEDLEDLCPVCVDHCTCQNFESDDDGDAERSTFCASTDDASANRRLNTKSAKRQRAASSLARSASSVSTEHCTRTPVLGSQTHKSGHSDASTNDGGEDRAAAIRRSASALSADKMGDFCFAQGVLSVPTPAESLLSDGDDCVTDDDDDDDDDEDCLKYDSVEYEYIVSDLQEDEVISEIALLEDPIESLDVLLFGSSDADGNEDDDDDQMFDSISFEIDLIPAQQHTLPCERSQPENAAASRSSSTSFVSMPAAATKALSAAASALVASTNSATSPYDAPSFSAYPPRSQSATCFFTQNTGRANAYTPNAVSSTSGFQEAYDVGAFSDDFDCDVSEGGNGISGGGGGGTSENMLNIEDIIECHSLCNSRSAMYNNEFLELYKHIPISAFRRSRRRSVTHKTNPSIYKRFLKHEDTMLWEGRPETADSANVLHL